MIEPVILDASALLAAFKGEKGSEAVTATSGKAMMSAVNVAEVRTRMIDWGHDQAYIDDMLELIGLDIVSFDAEQARICSSLRRSTIMKGLSLGDRACLALAVNRNAEVFTADKVWEGLDVPVTIHMIR
jgi:ribonuclease VapC